LYVLLDIFFSSFLKYSVNGKHLATIQVLGSRFWVHGSGFTVGRFALYIILEIGDESANSSMGSPSQFLSIFKFAGRYELFVQGYIKLALNFRARPLGLP